MSFPWDGYYAVILSDWPAPDDARVSAGDPFSDLGQAAALQHFDAVQLISPTDYELVSASIPPQTLVYQPDSRRFHGVVHQLRAVPEAVRRMMTFGSAE